MSPTQAAPVATYTPTSDALDRHEYGVSKHRKSASTGGGRAWSEDEEVYLLQTRLQKMPYKHIAAHLKKTELACRLHYHQLSHGSNRRKRNASCSSISSDSPIMAALAPSPDKGRSMSPPISAGGYEARGVQLPSIMEGRLPVILPKPAGLGAHPDPHSYGMTERQLPPVSFSRESSQAPSLRLDCSGLPRPSVPSHTAAHVDMSRLHAIYSAYRNTFWSAVAHEYGANAPPAVLEQAWKTGMCCSQRGGSPITPVDSPDDDYREDKTRISAILEATPRNARDRDMVRRIEGERFGN